MSSICGTVPTEDQIVSINNFNCFPYCLPDPTGFNLAEINEMIDYVSTR